jgi:general L-amino acid transport system permease protein
VAIAGHRAGEPSSVTLVGNRAVSKNWLLAQCARVYVEVMRNIPLLLQIIFWWAVFRESLPARAMRSTSAAQSWFPTAASSYPVPVWEAALWPILIAFFAGIAGSWWVARWARVRQEATGEQFPVFGASVGMILGLPLLVWLATGMPGELSRPVLRGFNFVGGGTMTPEFAALLIGPRGLHRRVHRRDRALGYPGGGVGPVGGGGRARRAPRRIMRLVVLPQALRVIIPPMTSQYLNITKNSSLAVAIGYPEIVSIAARR